MLIIQQIIQNKTLTGSMLNISCVKFPDNYQTIIVMLINQTYEQTVFAKTQDINM